MTINTSVSTEAVTAVYVYIVFKKYSNTGNVNNREKIKETNLLQNIAQVYIIGVIANCLGVTAIIEV